MNKILKKNWFISQIKPNSYDIAIRNLERQGFETFLPKMEITMRNGNRFIYKNRNVFPGYLFVGFDSNIILWTKINNTYGVSRVLSFNEKPSEISYDLIKALKSRYQTNSVSIQKENLQKGDVIKFNNGPFADLIARVENMDEKNRIYVLLEAMGGNQRLKLNHIENIKYNKI
tara:strand:+ start:2934 stop:3452 length:519 start_codon:yes stop_codon:yes gene_type:complete